MGPGRGPDRPRRSADQAPRPPAAVAPLEEALALFRAQGEPWGQARALGGLGNVALDAGQLPLARARFEAALALRTPDDHDLLFADLAIALGEVLRFEGDYRHAVGPL